MPMSVVLCSLVLFLLHVSCFEESVSVRSGAGHLPGSILFKFKFDIEVSALRLLHARAPRATRTEPPRTRAASKRSLGESTSTDAPASSQPRSASKRVSQPRSAAKRSLGESTSTDAPAQESTYTQA